MPAQPVQYEGTWEDILSHSQELAGLRVRLTIVDVGSLPTDSAQAEQELITEFHTLVDLELNGKLSVNQAKRLAEIENRFDAQESLTPGVRALESTIEDGNKKLDEIIAVLNDNIKGLARE